VQDALHPTNSRRTPGNKLHPEGLSQVINSASLQAVQGLPAFCLLVLNPGLVFGDDPVDGFPGKALWRMHHQIPGIGNGEPDATAAPAYPEMVAESSGALEKFG